jgi:hypothetical protein
MKQLFAAFKQEGNAWTVIGDDVQSIHSFPRGNRTQHCRFPRSILAACRDRHAGLGLTIDPVYPCRCNGVIGLPEERFTSDCLAQP